MPTTETSIPANCGVLTELHIDANAVNDLAAGFSSEEAIAFLGGLTTLGPGVSAGQVAREVKKCEECPQAQACPIRLSVEMILGAIHVSMNGAHFQQPPAIL